MWNVSDILKYLQIQKFFSKQGVSQFFSKFICYHTNKTFFFCFIYSKVLSTYIITFRVSVKFISWKCTSKEIIIKLKIRCLK